jgi:two-component system, NarL family, response regulator DegU
MGAIMNKNRSIKIVIVDLNIVTRKGLKVILTETPEPYEVLALFAHLSQSESFLQQHSTNILIVDDAALTPAEIIRFVKHCYKVAPELAILVLSERRDREYLQHLLQYGTVGFVLKDADLENQLPLAVKLLSEKYLFISPTVAKLIGEYTSKSLSQRDLDLLFLLARELNVKEIAAKLDITEKTVYRIREKLKNVLNVRNNEMIVDAARRKGYLSDKQLE